MTSDLFYELANTQLEPIEEIALDLKLLIKAIEKHNELLEEQNEILDGIGDFAYSQGKRESATLAAARYRKIDQL